MDKKTNDLHERLLQNKAYGKEKIFWKKHIKNISNVTNFVANYNTDYKEKTYKQISTNIENDIAAKLFKITNNSNLNLYSFLTSVLDILGKKYGNSNVNIASPLYDESHDKNDSSIVILPFEITNEKIQFKKLIRENRALVVECYNNQNLPYEQLVTLIGLEENNSITQIGCVLKEINNIEALKKLHIPVIFSFGKVNDKIIFNIAYTFKDNNLIKNILKQYIYILKQILNNPSISISDIEIVDEEEKKIILNEFNNTKVGYPRNRSVVEIFEEAVNEAKDNIALTSNGMNLTYGELNERANKIANFLIGKGIKRDNVVGILCDRSIESIVSILGVVKAGAAYMPIDDEYPKQRIEYMLKDSGSKILLGKKNKLEELNLEEVTVERVHIESEEIENNNIENPNIMSLPEDMIYIIYTSGSTGKPKGVGVEHRGVVRLVKNNNNMIFRENNKFLKNMSMSFDPSVLEIWGSLLNKMTLVVIKKEITMDINKLGETIEKENIKSMTLPTPLFNSYGVENPKIFKGVECLQTGGDVISSKAVSMILNECEGIELVNAYGPTENTVISTAFIVKNCWDEQQTVPIGRPISNSTAYIMDKNNKLLPIGVSGELCVGGDGVTRGYLNREDLTKEKFIENPYVKGERIYKTGDLARWLPDGNIEFLGRIDNQVKIRGYRIELGEIEKGLLENEEIKEVIVIDRKDENGNKYLCAYVVGEKELIIEQIKGKLSEELPIYMVPTYIMQLESMPLNQNGKIDRKALQEVDVALNTKEYVAPRNEVEEKLAVVIGSVLALDKTSIKDSFIDIGGDSIKAIQVSSRLRKYEINIEVKDILGYKTIEVMAKHIKNSEVKAEQGIVQGKVKLTPIQKEFIEVQDKAYKHFNQAMMLCSKEGFDEKILKSVMTKIVEHHDALRMVIGKGDNKHISYNKGVDEKLYDFYKFNYEDNENLTQKINKEASCMQASMDLVNGPLVKVALFKTTEGDHLLIAIHHHIVDGVSWRIILEDLLNGYKALKKGEKVEFPQKTTSFEEWAEKQYEYSNSKKLLKELKYWQEITNKAIDEIPRDNKSEESLLRDQKDIIVKLNREETEKLLKESNRVYSTEINDILLSSLGLAVKKWTGMKSLAVTLEGHGREDILKDVDITRTIGWFTSAYPVVLDLCEENIGKVIKKTKENLRKVPNKGIGYGILKYLTSKENKNYENLDLQTDISFNYLGQFDEYKNNEIFQNSNMPTGNSIGENFRFPSSININSMVSEGELNITISYNSLEYKNSSIERFGDLYKEALINVVKHCIEKEETEYIGVDYGVNEYSIEEIDELKNFVKKEIGEKVIVEKINKLTPMQEGMLFTYLENTKTTAYVIQLEFDINGEINLDILNKAYNKLLKRHEILRTIIYENNVHPTQVILKNIKAEVEYEDFSNLDNKEEVFEKYKKDKVIKGFNIFKDILFKLSLIKQENNKYKLLINSHHIILDGWSNPIILEELLKIYEGLKNGEDLKLEKAYNYDEYIKWLAKQDKEEALDYWKNYLERYDTTLTLPNEPLKKVEYKEGLISTTLNNETLNKLRKIASKYGVTMSVICEAIWGIALQKYNNTDDVVFGMVVSGRPSEIEGVEKTVGIFINSIPVRVKSKEKESFVDLVVRIQEESNKLKSYEFVALADIQNLTDSKQNLVKYLMEFENYPLSQNKENRTGFKIKTVSGREETNYDFNISFVEENELSLDIMFNRNMYKDEFIKKILEEINNLFECVAENEKILVNDIEIIRKEEKKLILERFNNTANSEYLKYKTIAQLFEEVVERNQDSIAVTVDEKSLTYKELNERANSLARLLREKGVGRDSKVAIMVDRSEFMVIGVMAIIKSGGIYVPIDSDYPEERKKYMLKDCGAPILLTQKNLINEISFEKEIIDIEEPSIYMMKNTNLKNINEPNDLIYIIYTSGTTGKPKGVMVEHKNLVNIALSWIKDYRLKEFKLKLLQVASLSFDVFTGDLCKTLLTGGEMVICSKDARLDSVELYNIIDKNKVNMIDSTPGLINTFMDYVYENNLPISYFKLLIVGADICSVESFNRLNNRYGNQIRILNGYGITETTVESSFFELEKGKKLTVSNLPIGKPMQNTKFYVLDKNKKMLPIGVFGELYIGGAGVTRGYLNKEEMTKEKFVEDIYNSGCKMYKTGDMARWLPDGNIELVGRMDNQVKVRGFRIELGEIETVLLKYEKISKAVVVAKSNNNGGNYLVGFIVGDKEISELEVKKYLQNNLPDYMVPNSIIKLDEMPLTPNQKVDRKLLLSINVKLEGIEYIAPRNEVEKKLATVVSSVLGVKKVSIKDSFFEIGGDSIKAIQVSSRVRKYGINIAVKDILSFKTIEAMAKCIKSSKVKAEQGIVQGEVKITPIQKEFIKTQDKDNNHFNQAMMVYCKEGFDEEILKTVIKKIVEHHDALRIVVRKKDNNYIAYNKGVDEKLYDFYKFNYENNGELAEKINKEASCIQASMDLENGPLVKVALFKTSEGDHLLIAIHHYVVDGVSWRIIFEDLLNGYKDLKEGKEIKLPQKTTSFKEWVEKQYEYSNSKIILKELKHWRTTINKNIEQIPRDSKSDERLVKHYKNFTAKLTKKETEKLLKEVNRAYSTEINDILLCSLGRAVKKWAEINSLCITLEGHGREDILKDVDITRTVGWFTSEYPVVLDLQHENIGKSIKKTKEQIRKIENKGIGYGILKYLTSKENKNYENLDLKTDISFNYLGQFDEDKNNELFKNSEMSTGSDVGQNCKFSNSIEINCMVTNGQLNICINYNNLEYKSKSIEKFINLYRKMLVEVINHCVQKEEIEYIGVDYGINEYSVEEIDELKDFVKKEIGEKVIVEKINKLTPMQEGMLFTYLKNKETTAYVIQTEFDIKGQIKLDILNKVYNTLLERHEALRTVIHENSSHPAQIVLKNINNKVEYEDFSNLDNKEEVIENYKKNKIKQGFNIFKDVLFKFSLIKQEDEKHKLLITSHHIVLDGWSSSIILEEFFNIYESFNNEEKIQLEKAYNYDEYIKWLSNQDKEEALTYWKNYLEGYDTALALPNETLKKVDYKEGIISTTLNNEILKKLRKIASKYEVTMSILCEAIWGIILQKYNNTDDVVFGMVVSGRPSEIERVEKTVGMFINSIPVRVKAKEKESFVDLVVRIQEESNKLKSYEYISLADIQNLTMSKQNLIKYLMVFQNYPSSEVEEDRLGFEIDAVDGREQTNYDFNMCFVEEEGLLIRLMFNKNMYNDIFVNKFLKAMNNIFEVIINNEKVLVSDIDIIGEEEKKVLLKDFNDTKVDYPIDKSAVKIFEEVVSTDKDNIALTSNGIHLTYRELNERANKVANFLREKAIGKDDVVGILCDRSIETVVAILGVVKAGAAYMPIDEEFPKQRIEYMLQDSGSKILLGKKNNLKEFNLEDVNVQIISIESDEVQSSSIKNPNIINLPEDMMYVIYTSGSTGKPKGVCVEHRNVISLVINNNHVKFNKNEKILKIISMAFDPSIIEIWGSLLNGKELFIAQKEEFMNVEAFEETVKKHNISFVQIPSALFASLVSNKIEIFKNIKQVALGGEVLSPKAVSLVLKKYPELKVINAYGPTENTVTSTSFEITENWDEDKEIPIGKPISNSTVYIMDKNNNLVPVGVSGELCVGGDGVARGYLNREDLTKEKFIENPYVKGERIYKTGDLARWLPDGNIEFLGRMDNQVKIRGYRIELREIEKELLKNKEIKEAIVIDKKDESGNKYLCAYVIGENELSIEETKEKLLSELPSYMVPTYIMQLESMPLNQNGKIDKKALPKVDLTTIFKEYVAPRNEIEEKICNIYAETLGVEKVGIKDDFFEIGGQSLKAINAVSKIQRILDIKVEVSNIFKYPIVEELAEYLSKVEEKDVYEEIKKVEKKGYYKASSVQKRMYAINQINKESISYNIPSVLAAKENFDKEKIEVTLNKIIERHEAFRTSFHVIDGELVQKINDDVKISLEVIKGNCNLEEKDKVNKLIEKLIKPFDLEKSPLIRAGIIELEDGNILVMDMHHIISDGVSTGIFTKEFKDIYEGKVLEEVKIQYKDYSEWQSKLEEKGVIKKQEKYWLEKFKGELPVINLPIDYKRPQIQSFEGDDVAFKLDEELSSKLNIVLKNTGTTKYMLMLATFNILLSKYSGQEDIIVGTPSAGRTHSDLDNTIGMFVNTLAIRNQLDGEKSFKEFLGEVKETTLGAFENQGYQLDELIEKLNIQREAGRNPLFDVMFAMQNLDFEEMKIGELETTSFEPTFKISKFDLTLTISEDEDKTYGTLEYSTKLFKEESIIRLKNHFENILKSVVKNIDIKLKDIEVVNNEEKEVLIKEFNNTKVDYPRNKSVVELFEEVVIKAKDNIALTSNGINLTYGELNERANKIANFLREKGVIKDSVVGIFCDRNIETIVGILGIVKAGGAYLPIDKEYPEQRVKYMLGDSGAKIFLGKQKDIEKINLKGINVEKIDLESKKIRGNISKNPTIINIYKDLIYIIYTSGSTGKPKGVCIENRNVVRLVKNTNYVELKAGDRILQTGSMAFDASTFELWGSLLNGLNLYIEKKDVIMNSTKIKEYIDNNKITTMWLTAPLFNLFAKENSKIFNNLKYLLVGGDVVLAKYVNEIKKNNREINIINGYGPTENTTFSTTYTIDSMWGEDRAIPIGKPISNSTAYIMDKNNKLLPMGVVGELYVGGDGIARGYLNKEELTKEKFIENPCVKGERIYKTGDLARWFPDGNIEFIGRIDNQVKIRGYRIELGEIEKELLKNEEIKEVIVIDRNDESGNKYLCAYVVGEKEINIDQVKEKLLGDLPSYMIPSYIMQLKRMPLNQNGKIDRRSLPELDSSLIEKEYVAPRNEIEEKVASIYAEVLGLDKVSVKDNFFEIGGHSLKAINVVSKLQKELEVKVEISNIFSYPTVEKLSEYLSNVEEKEEYAVIEKVGEKEYYKASSVQKRMYAINQIDKESLNYNMPSILATKGSFEKEKIEITLNKIIERHEVFRTSFHVINEELVQKINDDVKLSLEVIKANYKLEEKDKVNKLIEKLIKPFDLEKAPLIRVGIIELEGGNILVMDMHHIISDGVSQGIFTREFKDIYEGKELEEVKIQYKDYSEWQSKLEEKGVIKKQEKYWLNKFTGEIPVLSLPTDYKRPQVQSFEGEALEFKLDEELSSKLNIVLKNTGTTKYMLMLAAFNILLSKYSGQEDIIVGTPSAGRTHADLDNTIGMFVNTLAIRNQLDGENSFKEFLGNVKETTLGAFENQGYQLDKLMEKLNIQREAGRNPLFDVMFSMQNLDIEELKIGNLDINSFNLNSKISKFDLTLTLSESAEKTYGLIQYSTKLFKKETIIKFKNHFENILNLITENQDIKLKNIEILTRKEKDFILNELNNTDVQYPMEKTVNELFEEVVEKDPEGIAVIYEDTKLTYKELNQKANSLARFLREKGVKKDSVVGLMVDRSVEMIVGIMGIIKAGGAYLPIDPEYPEARKEYMLQNSNAKLGVTKKKYLANSNFENIEWIKIEDEEIYKKNNSNISNCNSINDLIYIIYTSGTTGKPKGIMLEHRNTINVINAFHDVIYSKYEGKLTLALLSPYVFDASIKHLFTSLIKGHTLAIIKNDDRYSGEKICDFYIKNHVDISDGTPAHLEMIANVDEDKNIGVKEFIIGGDKLSIELLKRFKGKYGNNVLYITNMYGPTECSVDITTYLIDLNKDIENESIPIGKPLANYKVFIMDKYNKMVPIGVKGQLCVSGYGLARGYINNEMLTNGKFVKNPYLYGERMYKTGDLAKWRPDGNIEFLGRIDYQVKIRGYRIELGEIEKELLKNEAIKEAVVIDRVDKSKSRYLCAYVVGEKKLSSSEIKEKLLCELPNYMIPSYIVQLKSMPLNQNGKIDRKALPEVDLTLNTKEYEAPRNEIEEKVASIYAEVLGADKVSVKDNFFEIGGHSLKAINVVSKLQKELEIKVEVGNIFSYPTVEKISEYLSNVGERKEYVAIKKVEEKEYYEISAAQRRMYAINQMNKESINYNMSRKLVTNGKFDKEKIQKTLNKIIERHESFRTSFHIVKGEVVQKINSNIELNVEKVYSNYKLEEKEKVSDLVVSFMKPFNLEKAPILRALIIELKDANILIIDMHHIISDGVSMGVFIREFKAIYEGKELKDVNIQYKDFANWQNNIINKGIIKKQEDYWVNKFKGKVPMLNMPTDYKPSEIRNFEGEILKFTIEESVTSKINKLLKKTGVTKHILMLAAFNVLLSKYSEQEDVTIGIITAGRTHADLENTIGMFVNTLPIITNVKADDSFKELIEQVKANQLEAFENQDYQFDNLVEKIRLQGELGKQFALNIVFTVTNASNEEIQIKGLDVREFDVESKKISKFDLSLAIEDTESTIKGGIEYSVSLFKKETIMRLKNNFENILRIVAENEDVKLKDIELIKNVEKELILNKFNSTRREHKINKTIPQLFEESVNSSGNNMALKLNGIQLTYKELNERSNKIANFLRKKGVTKNQIVGILSERNIDTIIGILGIVKAGAVYLPIDDEYPNQRIMYMIEDSKAQILLGNKGKLENLNMEGIEIEKIDLNSEKIISSSEKNVDIINNAEDMLYVIYTSGTTGRPKGVCINHRGVVNLVKNNNYIKLKENNRFLKNMSMSFDPSALEIWGSLLNKMTLCLVNKETTMDATNLEKVIEKENISIMILPTQLFNTYGVENPKMFKNLEYLIVGGDVISSKAVSKTVEQCENMEIINAYGPTENTVISTAFSIKEKWEEDKIVPIGKPISNTKAYIMDKDNKLLPIGMFGELYVGGNGLATGYLNRLELTKEKFIENPYIKGERLYKTGDIARWLPDGNIEFRGREDHQLKIRGYRVDIGEIEKEMLVNKKIKEAVVISKQDTDKNKYLCAYVVGEKEINVNEIKERLSETLPSYMIPLYIIQVEKMPLSKSGKIDKKELKKIEITVDEVYVSPKNEMQEILELVFAQVLERKRVSIESNFFEIGGDSINAIKILIALKKYNIEVNVKDIFRYKTIEKISQHAKKSSENIDSTKLLNINTNLILENLEVKENVIKLKDSYNNKNNVFILHDVTGNITGYYDFIDNLKLDNYNIYGINADERYKENFVKVSMEELALNYIDIIKKIQPEGPYYIFGWSLGGIIAFEIVKQLEKNNDKIGKLIIADGHLKNIAKDQVAVSSEKNTSNVKRSHDSDKTIDEVIGMFKKNNIHELHEKDKKMLESMIGEFESQNTDVIISKLNMMKTLVNALERYYPETKIKSNIYFIKAKDTENDLNLWNKLTGGLFIYNEVEGNHLSIFQKPYVNKLIEKFLSYIL